MITQFEHIQSAHCETGVTRNLLKNAGINNITEPLAFGIGAGLFFIYVPLLKINNGPAIAFRSLPGAIFNGTCSSLGIPVTRKKFSEKQKAQHFLDSCLNEGRAVGCQVGVYFLPYFPKEYRFHFNAHNLVVYGRHEDEYLISDPVMEKVTTLSSYELERVRFAKGTLAPKGQLYYPERSAGVSDEIIRGAIRKGIKKTVGSMLHAPLPIVGVRGISFLGRRITRWREKLGLEKAGLYLAQLVRMQEEIGTGGGGFRFMYGAFLQEATAYHRNEELQLASAMFTESGDLWRAAALQAAGIYKGRLGSQADFDQMGGYLQNIHDVEKKALRHLSEIKWQ